MRRNILRTALAWLMLVVPLRGTSQVPPPEEPFAESIEVTVVNVDVVARDRSGNQVPGLTKGDFKLFVDGKQVEITNFYAAGASPLPAAPAAGTVGTPAFDGVGATGRERLNLVVYVDNANMKPFDRNRVLKQLRSFLQKTLEPEDQVLVVTDDLGLHIRHPFQEAMTALNPELDQLEKESGLGISQDNEARQAFEMIRQLGCGSLGGAESVAQGHAEQMLAELKNTYANLQHLIQSLGGLDGRKVLLYVGNGVPVQAGTDVFGLISEMCPTHTVGGHPLDATAPLRAVVATANANLVTLYSLEASGLRNYVSAETARPLMSYQLNSQVTMDRQDSLTTLAKGTGGRAALNANDFGHDLDGIASDLNGGYSLGFTPTRSGDRKMHTLKVEVTRQHLQLSYREGYRERSPAERLEGQIKAALLHGRADNPLGAALKLGESTPSEHGKVLVPVKVSVPFGKLTFVPQADGRHGRIIILAENLDGRGGMSPVHRMEVPLHIPDADAGRVLASRLGYDVKLLLEPGRQRVAIVVVDEASHVSSCVLQDLDVDKKGTAIAAAEKAN
jgi:VWFA-related protein